LNTELKLNTRNIQHKVTLGSTQWKCTVCNPNSYSSALSVPCIWSSHVIWKPKMVWKCARSDLRGSKIQNFSGGHAPDPLQLLAPSR